MAFIGLRLFDDVNVRLWFFLGGGISQDGYSTRRCLHLFSQIVLSVGHRARVDSNANEWVYACPEVGWDDYSHVHGGCLVDCAAVRPQRVERPVPSAAERVNETTLVDR